MALTHWDRDKMAAIPCTIFSNAFSWMKMYEFWLRFHWSLLLRVQLTIFQHLFREWLGTDNPLSEPMVVSLLTFICVTPPQGVILRRAYLDRNYKAKLVRSIIWWRHDMSVFVIILALVALVAVCMGNPRMTRGFPIQTATNAGLYPLWCHPE